jgi:hypothetical protein
MKANRFSGHSRFDDRLNAIAVQHSGEGFESETKGVVREVIEIAKRRAGLLAQMRESLFAENVDEVIRLARILCGLDE